MKFSLVFLAGIFALALANPVEKKVQLERQKQVLQLFYHINQPSYNPDIVEVAKSFSVNDHVDSYSKPEVVKAFMQYYKYDLLPRGQIFSVFNDAQLHQAVALFRLFYYAKDFQTFYKTAAWARQNVNEGMFIYSFSVAVIHRPDTREIVLPPIYEIYPYYFFSSEVINKVQQLKQRGPHVGAQAAPEKYIQSNYSGWYLNLHPEQSMSYYLEDVGINAFYYYYNLHYPVWMGSEEFGWTDARRGEIYYYVYQQILARYYLERISNGFGEVPLIDWEAAFIETPYTPSLTYPNGLEFPSRPKYAKLSEYFYNYGQKYTSNVYSYSYSLVRDIERRINDAIDSGFIFSAQGKMVPLYTEDGLNVLGNLIQANKDTLNYRFFGPMMSFARHLLGYAKQPLDWYKLAPSALEHYETSLRDPAFYQLAKKLVLKFQRYYSQVQPYSEKELVFPGVKVSKVEVDDLVTYDDWFYTDLQNAVYYGPEEESSSFHLRVRQQRLNHKMFSYKINVKSDKEQQASVKIFLGPKYDEYEREMNLTENRLNFVEIDHFVYDLKSGENVIERGCHNAKWYSPDRVSDPELYKRVVDALENNAEFKVDPRQNFFSFPQRYMLPRGSEAGTSYQFFVIVYPYVPLKGRTQQPSDQHIPRPGTSDIFVDNSSLGYPFDRFVRFERMWYNIPNMYFQEEKIYHKEEHDINVRN